jgi:hypothetical protein
MSTPISPLPPEPQIAVFNDAVYVRESNDFWDGWQKTNAPVSKKPTFTWKRSLIPFDLWEQCLSFMRWTQEEFKSESLILFFYHTEEDRWAAAVFPQTTMGMTVSLDHDDPAYAQIRAEYGNGWIQAGTLHHHCTSAAFQSGTDKTDEENRDGVHITVGKVLDEEVDSHVRVSFGGVEYASSLDAWIEAPDWLNALPLYLQTEEFVSSLNLRPTDCDFPEEWQTLVKKRVTPPFNQGHWKQNYTPIPSGVNTPTTLLTNGKKKDDAGTLTDREVRCLQTIEDLALSLGLDYHEVGRILDDKGLSDSENSELFAETFLAGLKSFGFYPYECKTLFARHDIIKLYPASSPYSQGGGWWEN